MAAMVARGSGPLVSSSSIPEKGSRNKRKFRAEPPIADPNLDPHSLEDDLPNYELFRTDKPAEKFDQDYHLSVCDVCQNHDYGPREEVEVDEFNEADWSGLTEIQLEETVLCNLDVVFRTAIKTITSYGYTEEAATSAVLKSGVFYGCKGTVTNITENALAVLRSGQELHSLSSESSTEELKKLERSVLTEMVNVLREMRPSFSVGNAMWCLLISDMNVTHACAMDCSALSGMGSEMTIATSTTPQAEQEAYSSGSTSQNMAEVNASGHSKPNSMLLGPRKMLQTEFPAMTGLPNLPSGRFSASSNVQDSSSSVDFPKENTAGSSERMVEFSASISISSQPEMKPSGGKKVHLSSSKRESILRQKSAHLEKSYRMFGSKAAIRAGKHGLGGLLLDKKCKPVSETNAMKNTMMKLNKAGGNDTPQADPTINLSFNAASVKAAAASNILPPVPVANTELSLSLPAPSAGTNSGGMEASFLYDKMCGNWIPHDKKDEMLLRLVPRVRELQAQLQEWTDWGQQKVMQAARRLGKDKPELLSLRQEKEEVARLKKEKQTLEENTRKKLAEMEIALSRASSQVEATNATARSLQVENSELRKEMEAAKLRAAESEASCQEVSSRETKTQKQFQSWEKQKALLHEELSSEKRKLSQLKQQHQQAKDYLDQLEARWKQEEKAKDEVLLQASIERKEREHLEISGRSKENAMRLKAETDMQRHKDEVKKLEQQIAQLRLRNDSSKIAALKWGIDGTYASRLSDGRKENEGPIFSKLFDFQESEEVQRERECVMCLTEEMSVVFLPCAHQVVCTKCNELHERQGMSDCPSCRTPIQRRICVRSAES